MDDEWDDDWRDYQDELADNEYPDEPDQWDEPDEVECPHCGAMIYDDAVQCPVCGEYITFATSPWQGKPWWWIVVGLLGIGATLYLLSAF